MLAKIKSIIVNWHYTSENGEDYAMYVVGGTAGGDEITEIIDQRKHDDGILVIFLNGSKIREFNINQIEYFRSK